MQGVKTFIAGFMALAIVIGTFWMPTWAIIAFGKLNHESEVLQPAITFYVLWIIIAVVVLVSLSASNGFANGWTVIATIAACILFIVMLVWGFHAVHRHQVINDGYAATHTSTGQKITTPLCESLPGKRISNNDGVVCLEDPKHPEDARSVDNNGYGVIRCRLSGAKVYSIEYQGGYLYGKPGGIWRRSSDSNAALNLADSC